MQEAKLEWEHLETKRQRKMKHTLKKSGVKLKLEDGDAGPVRQLKKAKKPKVDTHRDMVIPNEIRE